MKVFLPDNSQIKVNDDAKLIDVAAAIGAGLAKASIAGKIDGSLADLSSPVHDGAKIEIITNKSSEALSIMRHSCAHILAEAVRSLYPGTEIGFGPNTEDGFFYDFDLPCSVSSDDFEKIEEKMQEIIKKNEPFVRKVVNKTEAKEIFKDQSLKLEHIDDLSDNEEISVYSHGSFDDLCSGPHVPDSSKVGAFKLTKIAGAY